MIEKTILAEENRFEAVLTDGLPRLEAEIAKVVGGGSKVLPGDAAFKLYDTFGVPFDFIEDTAATQGRDRRSSRATSAPWKAQRDKARAGSTFGRRKEGRGLCHPRRDAGRRIANWPAIKFEGYTTTRVTGVPVLALFDEQRQPTASLSRRSDRVRRDRQNAVLSRIRRSGVGLRSDLQRSG